MPSTPLRLLLLLTLAVLPATGLRALPPEIPAHQLVRQQWTVADGLPQVTVLDIAQDPTGFLWLATQNGLARFDGHRFDLFRLREHPQLNHNYTNALAAEADGTLWVGTSLGLARGSATGFASLTPDGEPTGSVQRLLPAAGGGVWVGAERGLFQADGDGLRRLPQPVGSGRVVALADSADGSLVVAFADRLLVDPAGRSRVLQVADVSDLRSLAAGTRDDGPWLWLGSSDGVAGIDADGRVVARHLRGREIEALLEDRHGTLWVASDDGLWRILPGARARRAAIDGLAAGSWIRSLHQDREGNLWVGSHISGVFRLRAGLFRRLGSQDGLTDDIVWSLYADPRGGIWAGTSDGVLHGDLERGFERPIASADLPHPMVLAFLRAGDGSLWIGTRQGAVRIPPGGGRPRPVAGVDAMIYSLTEDRRGRIWVGSRQGVQRVTDGRVETLGLEHGLPAVTARGIVEMSDGRIWIGTDLGAYIEEPGGFRPLAAGSGFDSYRVQMLRETRPGEVIMAVQGGIAHTSLAGDQVRLLGENEGLHVGMVMALHSDRRGRLWYASHDGIGRIPFGQLDAWLAGERERLAPTVVGRLDEPQAAQCNGGHHNAGLLVDDRWLWCPSLHGALVLDIDAVAQKPAAPQPAILALRGSDGAQWSVGNAAGPLRLPLGERDLQIDFTGIHLRDPDAVRFRVQLIGYDGQPQEIGARRTAFYTNLPPGRYRFEVHAEARHAGGSAAPAVLEFVLPPRAWETGGFQALLLLALAGLAFGAFRLRLRQLEQQRRTLTELVAQRTRELEEANAKLVQTSVTDPLTGLRNRRYLLNEIRQDVAQVERIYTTGRKDANRDLLFLMIDLDHFKVINDRHGHHAGDQILVQLAQILDRQVRECDYVVRWGGEEFLVIGRQVDRNHSTVLADRIVSAIRGHSFVTDHGVLRCSCSIGIAVFPPLPARPGAFGWEDTIEIADAAMYLAKQEGRDRWIELRPVIERVQPDFMERFRASPASMATGGELDIRRERAADPRSA
jgi:diguanylate cyclase (GGDEF)-like protein